MVTVTVAVVGAPTVQPVTPGGQLVTTAVVVVSWVEVTRLVTVVAEVTVDSDVTMSPAPATSMLMYMVSRMVSETTFWRRARSWLPPQYSRSLPGQVRLHSAVLTLVVPLPDT